MNLMDVNGPKHCLEAWQALRKLAEAQRQLIWGYPLAIVAMLGGMTMGASKIAALFWALRLLLGWLVFRVARAWGAEAPVLWGIGGFLPNIIGLIVLFVANSRATKRLKAAGIEVGFMGTHVPEEPPAGWVPPAAA